MRYPVLSTFIEKEHNKTLYKEGETYPKKGFEADPKRVAFLQSNKNKYKIAFLGEDQEEVAAKQKAEEEAKAKAEAEAKEKAEAKVKSEAKQKAAEKENKKKTTK